MALPMFISLEGGDGAGKSTQAERLYRQLSDAGIPALLVREPGATPLGEHLREYLKSQRPLSAEAELLLFEAARVQLVLDIIKPSLAQGVTVITDRFEGSTIAYQGYGRGLNLVAIDRFNQFAVQDTLPDLTFLLDIDPAEGLRRGDTSQQALIPEDNGGPDDSDERRFEDAPLDFHRRVREGFLALAAANPQRWLVIDANRPPEEIEERIWRTVQQRLG